MDLFNREPVLQSRDMPSRAAPIPDIRRHILQARTHTFSARDSSSTCSSGDSSCSKGGGSSSTVPIVIGVVVPTLIAAIILFVLHRRHTKMQKQEDANDKYKSLDFGVDPKPMNEKSMGRRGNARAGTDISIADLKGELRRDRGLSFDLGQNNPYILPPQLQQSRESLHSLSRADDDKYRATNFIPDDGSIRSPSVRSGRDNDSTYTASTRRRFDTESKTDLIPKNSREGSEPPNTRRLPQLPASALLAPQQLQLNRDSALSTVSSNGEVNALRASNNYLGSYISGGNKPTSQDKKDPVAATTIEVKEVLPSPPAHEVAELPAAAVKDGRPSRGSSTYDNFPILANEPQELPAPDPNLPKFRFTDTPEPQELPAHSHPERHQSVAAGAPDNNQAPHAAHQPTLPNIQIHAEEDDDDASDYYDEEVNEYAEYQDYLGYTYRNSMMGMRPLPPDDPAENPEQRANRIRSFYKEYFEETAKPGARQVSYYDGSENYMDDVYGYYAESQPHSRGPSIRSDGRYRAMSHGAHMAPGPRAFSSMSGRPRPRQAPKKKLPPPKALMTLPTPHKLKDDDFLPNAIDYAPPQMIRQQRAGTPVSLRGESRPYSPSVRAFVPLATSFDDLAVVPSPHALRKSGTFTALDFAPPRRFKEDGTMSDAGSIRSNRSGISSLASQNIRAGAYRVSRIPKEVAGTKDDMFAALKPKWDMRGDSAIPGM